ncbi:hypothetical protein [Schleiferilactobacillus shenzhenensis]|uniref:Uncharacterized protein n=1 Tax=Schleiferilactobacillus shenzhenensis LY-73 TaxID=1231336 RepID=U4TR76_9LACO|nr:hypothetical protein [Schleiferilactobacillus shenzhenensis]ERL64012.1 hypothetical protein L248_1659 [Schleiferilactobacillus shenzhenensis LY-73]
MDYIYNTTAGELYRQMLKYRQNDVNELVDMQLSRTPYSDNRALIIAARINLLTDIIDQIEAKEKAPGAATSES